MSELQYSPLEELDIVRLVCSDSRQLLSNPADSAAVGKRPSRPPEMTGTMWELAEACWQEEAERRPPFWKHERILSQQQSASRNTTPTPPQPLLDRETSARSPREGSGARASQSVGSVSAMEGVTT